MVSQGIGQQRIRKHNSTLKCIVLPFITLPNYRVLHHVPSNHYVPCQTAGLRWHRPGLFGFDSLRVRHSVPHTFDHDTEVLSKT